MTRSYAARVFWIAGIFNIAAGAAGFVAPGLMAQSLGMARPPDPLFLHMTSWLVVVLGIGYCLTARSPERNQDFMLVGAIGKLLVLPLMFAAWHRGDVQFPAVVGGAADLVFALLFIDVLRRMEFSAVPSPG